MDFVVCCYQKHTKLLSRQYRNGEGAKKGRLCCDKPHVKQSLDKMFDIWICRFAFTLPFWVLIFFYLYSIFFCEERKK